VAGRAAAAPAESAGGGHPRGPTGGRAGGWPRALLSTLGGNVLVLTIASALTGFAESMVYPYEQLYLQALGATPRILGLLGSLASALVLSSRIAGAYAADRCGRKVVAVAAAYGVALSYAILAAAPSWELAAVGIALAGALSSASQPALQALVADSTPPQRRGLGYALVGTLSSAPSVLAPVAAALLVGLRGLAAGVRLAYWSGALLGLAAASIMALGLEETLRRSGQPASGLALSALRGALRPLAALALVLAVNSVEESMFRFLPLYVVGAAGVGEAEWGLLSSIFYAVPLVAGIPLGSLADSIGRRRAMLLAYALWVPSTLYLVRCRGPLQLVPVFIAFAAGASLFNPAHQAMLADLAPRAARGRVLGAVGALRLLASIPASALAGLLYEARPEYPFLLAAALGAANAALIALLLEEPARRER